MRVNNNRLFPIFTDKKIQQTVNCKYGPLIGSSIITDIETLDYNMVQLLQRIGYPSSIFSYILNIY